MSAPSCRALRVRRAQRDEVVAVADQHGAHAVLRVDLCGELARDRERDVFLARAAPPERAGVLAAVARVDRDHEVAALDAPDSPTLTGGGASAR